MRKLQHLTAGMRDDAGMADKTHPAPKRRSTSERFRTNLQAAIDYRKSMGPYTIAELAKESTVSERMIHAILAGEARPTIDVADLIGRALGFSGWVMLLEGFDPAVKQTEMFEKYLIADQRDQYLVETLLTPPVGKTKG